MAITIQQQPYAFTPLKQVLNVIATSTNFAESGFRYKVIVSVAGTAVGTFYQAPNLVNALVFNLRSIIEPFIYNAQGTLLAAGSTIHSMSGNNTGIANETTGNAIVTAQLYEAWLVGGILTDDPDTLGVVTATINCIWTAGYEVEAGYRPDPATRFAMTGDTKRMLSDRVYNTHKWKWAATFGFPEDATHTFIPVFEEDFGVLSLPVDNGTDLTGNDADRYMVTIHEADGTTTTATQAITAADKIAHLAVYPANLNASTGALFANVKPSANPNWRAISIVAQNNAVATRSQTVVLYNAYLWGDSDCRYDRIRIGWQNSAGAWDYFNFIKKSEKALDIDRKRYKQVTGNYGGADGNSVPFTYNSYDRGLRETKPQVGRLLSITSSWISEGEFELLQYLAASDNVHWLQDDGSVIPVLVEDTGYLLRRERSQKQYNQAFRLRLSHDMNT